jgi:hypothetical protein
MQQSTTVVSVFGFTVGWTSHFTRKTHALEKNARTLHAIGTNVTRKLYQTKYADARKTIYAKRNMLNDIRTLKRTLNKKNKKKKTFLNV